MVLAIGQSFKSTLRKCEKFLGNWWLVAIVALCGGGLLWLLTYICTQQPLYLSAWGYRSDGSGFTFGAGYKTWRIAAREDGLIRFITESNFESTLSEASNDWGELVLTTFGLWGNVSDYNETQVDYDRGTPAFTFNWVSKLKKSGVANFLIVGTSLEACQDISRINIPCFVNQLAWGKDIQERTWEGAFYVRLKWYYLLRITELGFHPIFMDNDALVLKSPFANWGRSFDFQGLADGTDGTQRGQLPERTDKLRCPLRDSLYRGFDYPCMSTGTMLIRATPATRALLAAMVGYLETHWREWEQAVFQRVVMPFLIQMGAGPPALKFRLLPTEKWHNVGDLKDRKANNLIVDSVVVHCGYIHGGWDKSGAFQSLGLWENPPKPSNP